MKYDLNALLEDYPDLTAEQRRHLPGATCYEIRVPQLSQDRAFEWADLVIPRGFPEVLAWVRLSPDAVLRAPHIESNGKLCVDGDPGPSSGMSPNDRLLSLLCAYQDEFLLPWIGAKLDRHFLDEPQNYWDISVFRSRSDKDAVTEVWTTDGVPQEPSLREGVLLLPSRIVLVGTEHSPVVQRVIASLGRRAAQRIRVRVLDIPLTSNWSPSEWPRSQFDLDSLTNSAVPPEKKAVFSMALRSHGRAPHRIVIFRNAAIGYAYLLPGGPSIVVEIDKQRRAYPARRSALPLLSRRFDPSWTVGRDQYPEVFQRQTKHVVIFGVGALGSFLVDHLAKAGIGRISIVDGDTLSSANIGRHLLGANHIGENKAIAVAQQIGLSYPMTHTMAYPQDAREWLSSNELTSVDVIIDATGEADVRWQLDAARAYSPRPLLIAWMEPFVVAAHVCSLTESERWLQNDVDPRIGLQAVSWPLEVILKEPGCSSRFQSYTAPAAAHAVALAAEEALRLIDKKCERSTVASWVRSQKYLDEHWLGLSLREWVPIDLRIDGMLIRRNFP